MRKAHGLTQGELAKRLGVTQALIASYESARRAIPLRKLCALARALGISLEEIIGDGAPAAVSQGPALQDRASRGDRSCLARTAVHSPHVGQCADPGACVGRAYFPTIGNIPARVSRHWKKKSPPFRRHPSSQNAKSVSILFGRVRNQRDGFEPARWLPGPGATGYGADSEPRRSGNPPRNVLGGELVAASATAKGRQRVERASRCRPDQRADPQEWGPSARGLIKRSAERAGRAPGGRRRQNSFLCDLARARLHRAGRARCEPSSSRSARIKTVLFPALWWRSGSRSRSHPP